MKVRATHLDLKRKTETTLGTEEHQDIEEVHREADGLTQDQPEPASRKNKSILDRFMTVYLFFCVMPRQREISRVRLGLVAQFVGSDNFEKSDKVGFRGSS